MGLRSAFSPIILLYILGISAAVRAYIPATPTNDTESAIQSGLNVTDVSMLSLLWYENGCVLSPRNSSAVGILNFELPFGCTEGVVRIASTSPMS